EPYMYGPGRRVKRAFAVADGDRLANTSTRLLTTFASTALMLGMTAAIDRGSEYLGVLVVEVVEKVDVSRLPLAPKNPTPYLRRVKAVRAHHIGMEVLRDAGGPVSRVSLGP